MEKGLIKYHVGKTFFMLNSIMHEISTAHKNENAKKYRLLTFELSDVVFIMQINFKMPTIVGILKFINIFKFMLS